MTTEDEELDRQLDESEQLAKSIALIVSGHRFSTSMTAISTVISALVRAPRNLNEARIKDIFDFMAHMTIEDWKENAPGFKTLNGSGRMN